MMEVQLCDILDRYSILVLKDFHIGTPEVKTELTAYRMTIVDLPHAWDTLQPYIDKLLAVNKKIWELESDIRRGKDNILGLEEIGRRAIQIRDYNRERVSIKNEISVKFGGFTDIKRDHGSEDNG